MVFLPGDTRRFMLEVVLLVPGAARAAENRPRQTLTLLHTHLTLCVCVCSMAVERRYQLFSHMPSHFCFHTI